MRLIVSINQDNAAFSDVGHNEETARILRALADEIADYRSATNAALGDGETVVLRDINGNQTGEVWQENNL